MGPGNSHDDEPRDEQPEDSGHEFGDESDEGRPGTRGPLPDPLDRVWLHPTELSSLAGPSTATRADTPRRHGRRSSLAWVAPVVAGAAGALLTLGVLAVTGAFDRTSSRTGSTLAGDAVTTIRAPSAADAVARLGPSVVAVFARDAKGSRRGSGVCVHHGTQLLTSGGVVGDADSVEVVAADGRSHTARVVGRDRVTDLVLLDLQDDTNLPAAQLADATPATGAAVWLLAGAARGAKSPWMSSGMTSSNDAIAVSDRGPATAGLLETDAASNAAVVGGGLVNASGAVAGIVLGHVNGSATTYAVPIDVAVGIARQLDATGVAKHGWLGIGGVDSALGPMVENMKSDAPAARAGMRVNDLVQSVDGRTVDSIADVMALVQSFQPGRTIAIGLRRGAEVLDVRVKLGAEEG